MTRGARRIARYRWAIAGSLTAFIVGYCIWLVVTDAPAYQFLVRLYVDPNFLKQTLHGWGIFAPVAFGMGLSQISAFVDQAMASTLPAGQLSALAYANRLRALPQRSALRYVLAKHIAGGKMRRGKPARQLFGLSPFPGPRRSEKNYRTVQLVIRATVRRHSVVSPPSYRVQVTGLPVTGAYRRPRNRPFRAKPS